MDRSSEVHWSISGFAAGICNLIAGANQKMATLEVPRMVVAEDLSHIQCRRCVVGNFAVPIPSRVVQYFFGFKKIEHICL